MRKDKVQVWRIEDADYCSDSMNEKAVPCLVFASKGDKYAKVLRRNADDATLEELVELCDLDAENVNAHDYCGAHRLLGSLLFKQLGRETATRVMRDIAERRGLHGMGGLCGLPDSFASLKVGEAGRHWTGTFK